MIGAAKIITVQSQHVLFKRVFSPALQSSRKWYPFNLSKSICGVSPKKYMSQSNFCSRFSTENAEAAYSDLIDKNGAQLSPSELDGYKKSGKGGYKKETVVVASSFGIIASMLRQNPTKASLFDEKICGRVRELRFLGRSQNVAVGYYIIVITVIVIYWLYIIITTY